MTRHYLETEQDVSCNIDCFPIRNKSHQQVLYMSAVWLGNHIFPYLFEYTKSRSSTMSLFQGSALPS